MRRLPPDPLAPPRRMEELRPLESRLLQFFSIQLTPDPEPHGVQIFRIIDMMQQ